MGDKFGIAIGEASTWRGLVYLMMAIGIKVSPELQGAIVSAGLAVASAFAIFTKQKGAESVR